MLHGVEDPLIPVSWACEGCDYLKKIGHNAEIFSYHTQHNICFEEVAVISSWLQKLLS
jgi:predicted esterase